MSHKNSPTEFADCIVILSKKTRSLQRQTFFSDRVFSASGENDKLLFHTLRQCEENYSTEISFVSVVKLVENNGAT